MNDSWGSVQLQVWTPAPKLFERTKRACNFNNTTGCMAIDFEVNWKTVMPKVRNVGFRCSPSHQGRYSGLIIRYVVTDQHRRELRLRNASIFIKCWTLILREVNLHFAGKWYTDSGGPHNGGIRISMWLSFHPEFILKDQRVRSISKGVHQSTAKPGVL